MSVDLSIKLVAPVSIQDSLSKIGEGLRDVLGLSGSPVIGAESYVNGVRHSLTQTMIAPEGSASLFRIEREPELVNVGTYFVEQPLLASDEQGSHIYVNVGSERSPLEYALAAAIAATFARELGTPVIDNTPFYTEVMSQSAETFISRIRVTGEFCDYRAAAKVFYERLPKRRRSSTQ